MKILAVIPARSGSKGVRNKNVRVFNGKPLLAHSIISAKNSECIDRVIVSTDSKDIARLGKKYGADVPFLRPRELARPKSEIVDGVLHLLDALKKTEEYVPDAIMLLQPTSPLRTSEHIDAAVALYKKKRADSLVSVCKTENLLFTKNIHHSLKALNPQHLFTGNRQNLPEYYRLDGSMIYLVNEKKFRKHKSFFAGKLIGFEIDRWHAVDIDEAQDFVVGELLHAYFKKITQRIQAFK